MLADRARHGISRVRKEGDVAPRFCPEPPVGRRPQCRDR